MLNIPIRSGQATGELLAALAEQLAARGAHYTLAIVGGSALLAARLVSRATHDVDVLAIVEAERAPSAAEPLPAALLDACPTVARDFGLPLDWLNPGPTTLLDLGLPKASASARSAGPTAAASMFCSPHDLTRSISSSTPPSIRVPESTCRTCGHSHPPSRSCSPRPRGAGPKTPQRATTPYCNASSPISESTMELPRLNRELDELLVAFAWEEWAQMGLSATAKRRSRWAQDPEALIVFTLEVARSEPRLFDELLDWMLLSEPLLSVRRLRAMCIDDDDRALVNGTLAWLTAQRPRARLTGGAPAPSRSTLEPLFRLPALRATSTRVSLRQVWRDRRCSRRSSRVHRSRARRSTSRSVFARSLVWGSAQRSCEFSWASARRASLPRFSHTTSGYAKRNVHDALAGLSDAGVIFAVTVGGERRYTADRDAWAALLHCDPIELPAHRDWRELFAALRRLLRFTAQPELEDLSDYLIASRTRDLLEAIRPELAFAGIPTSIGRRPRESSATWRWSSSDCWQR